jgi:DNA-binding transcriptional LysR family regulator
LTTDPDYPYSWRKCISEINLFKLLTQFDLCFLISIASLILVCSTPFFEEWIKGKKIPDVFDQVTFIAYDPFAPALRSWTKHHFGLFQFKPDIALSVESVRAVITAVEHHLGLGVVPAHLVQAALERGNLTGIELEHRPMTNQIAVVQMSNKIPTITEKSFIRYVEKRWTVESKSPVP